MKKHDRLAAAATFADQHETPRDIGEKRRRLYTGGEEEDRAAPRVGSREKVRVKKNGQNLAVRVAPFGTGQTRCACMCVCCSCCLEQFSRVHWQLRSWILCQCLRNGGLGTVGSSWPVFLCLRHTTTTTTATTTTSSSRSTHFAAAASVACRLTARRHTAP